MQTPNMPNSQPFRPPNEKDLVQLANGRAVFLGVIRSTGAAVDNSNTVAPNAPPFLFTPVGPVQTTTPVQNAPNMAGTLAGKMLFLQPSAQGFVRASPVAMGPGVTNVATQTLPIVGGTEPGISVTTGGVTTTMYATDGFLQWISLTGTADLYVWELL